MKLGNAAGAIEAFERCLSLAPEDIGVLVEMASIYENTNDYAKIVTIYDRIYSLQPSLVADKGMKKIYKKACKKSGEQGKFLDKM